MIKTNVEYNNVLDNLMTYIKRAGIHNVSIEGDIPTASNEEIPVKFDLKPPVKPT